ncbi:hypothetical protein VSS74_07790 [Conexibacter stalactiti]|uniref:Uncharacterized protein n=1 Tax=Conexibacter stalactiti TaxID=1940611 RepID=A0ABU4HNG2_9ACTN|nr:hypothetical protein [Conexibacter stalactiti]MDW5594232.1 hypothetical protein [Conexibacter stalactiti]MEC5034874.1 hypothetical protein [Conexibacter stalactiti]
MSSALSDAQALLRHAESSPYVDVDQRRDRATIRRAGARIATLDLESGALTIFLSAELVSPIVAAHPQLRTARDGVRLDVHDSDSLTAGEQLLRWRIGHELFASQWQNASP